LKYAELIIIGLLIVVALWLAWRYSRLRSQLKVFDRSLSLNHTMPSRWSDEIEHLAASVESIRSHQTSQLNEMNDEYQRLSAVLDKLTDGVLIVDSDGRIKFANPAAFRIFGEELIERRASEALRHHQLIQAWQRGQATGMVQSESVEIPSLKLFLQMIVIPDENASGETLLLVQDLTRLRRLETVRRDFVSNLSHELRTPLASLKALTETLTGGALDDPPAARKFINQIEIEVDALTQMVNELLGLSQIESGSLHLELRSVDVCDLLHSAAERMRLQAERAGLVLKVECFQDVPKVDIDALRLEQVLVNLIHNAVKFTHPGGTVVLAARAEKDGIQISVRDTGVGINPDDLSRIFERFYKSDRSRSDGGTGLGLSIARHIVEAHGGKIWAESELGQGSTFFFSIPFSLKSEFEASSTRF
jgi:two-component system phosphate regulon sensor histidine kinase PhoR